MHCNMILNLKHPLKSRLRETETGGLLGLLDLKIQWEAVPQKNSMGRHRVKPQGPPVRKIKQKTVSIMTIQNFLHVSLHVKQ